MPEAVDENGDPLVGAPTVSFVFDEVTGAGETTVTIIETGLPPVQGFQLGDPPIYFDLDTTASFAGSVEVCIGYSGISYSGPPENLVLFHDEGAGLYFDVTTLNDTIAMIICGSVTSFSVFAIFEPASPPVPSLSPLGLAMLWSLLGLAGWWRLRA